MTLPPRVEAGAPAPLPLGPELRELSAPPAASSGASAISAPSENDMPSPPFPELAPDFRVPVKGSGNQHDLRLTINNGLVSLVVREANLRDVMSALAETQGMNIICSANINTDISITLRDVPLQDAMTAIVSACGCTWNVQGNVIQVSEIASKSNLAPGVQGREIRVFPLDYASAEDVSTAIKTMLSPVGNAYVVSTKPDSIRNTRESIVVEDLPDFIPRVARYIVQMDQPPRQVMIEVHVLQVELEEGCRHGVDFKHMMHAAGHTLQVSTTGFTLDNPPQAFLAQLSAGNLTGVLEALKTSKDTKTLASPKVLALSGQTSHIQIGEKLGYRVLTNTQTSTMESVEFLNVGVVLEVTPAISRDDRVMMTVNPKVSSGLVNQETGLPNEKTSEVETSVLLRDGEGIIIGGLIQEEELDDQSKVYFLGDLYLIGGLFQRRVVSKSRKEIIFFLLPRIIPCCGPLDAHDAVDRQRAQTRLFHGALHPNPRPFDASMPDCYDRPDNSWVGKMHDRMFRPRGDCGWEMLPGSDWQTIDPTRPSPDATLPDIFPSPEPRPAEQVPPTPAIIQQTAWYEPLPSEEPSKRLRPLIRRLPAVEPEAVMGERR